MLVGSYYRVFSRNCSSRNGSFMVNDGSQSSVARSTCSALDHLKWWFSRNSQFLAMSIFRDTGSFVMHQEFMKQTHKFSIVLQLSVSVFNHFIQGREGVVITFLKGSQNFPLSIRDVIKLTPGYNLTWVKPLSCYGVTLSHRDEWTLPLSPWS